MRPRDADPAASSTPSGPVSRRGQAALRCEFTLVAGPEAAGLARRRVRRWLARLTWPDQPAQDIVYAVSEAVSNVAEHAYPDPGAEGTVEAVVGGAAGGVVTVGAAVEVLANGSRRVRARVRDRGRWQAPSPNPQHRGRGISMMATFMDEVIIHRGGQPTPIGTDPNGGGGGGEDLSGTEVVLISPPVPPTGPP